MQARARFGDLALHFWRKSRTKRSFWRHGACFWRKSRTKRSFWRLGASLWEEVSYETLVLKTWRFTFGGRVVRNARFGDLALGFGGSLVRNARFGDLALHFWRKSRTKRLFWRLGASLLEEVSYETLVLETWRFTFGGSLSFWRLGARTRHSFWSLGASLLEEVSYKTLALETWHFTFGGSVVRNIRFGDMALHVWRKCRTTRLFWDMVLHFWRKSRTKRSF